MASGSIVAVGFRGLRGPLSGASRCDRGSYKLGPMIDIYKLQRVRAASVCLGDSIQAFWLVFSAWATPVQMQVPLSRLATAACRPRAGVPKVSYCSHAVRFLVAPRRWPDSLTPRASQRHERAKLGTWPAPFASFWPFLWPACWLWGPSALAT